MTDRNGNKGAGRENTERGAAGGGKPGTRRGEYKGNPLLIVPLGENRDFSFGVAKARAILECLDEIRDFVAECGAARGEALQAGAGK